MYTFLSTNSFTGLNTEGEAIMNISREALLQGDMDNAKRMERTASTIFRVMAIRNDWNPAEIRELTTY